MENCFLCGEPLSEGNRQALTQKVFDRWRLMNVTQVAVSAPGKTVWYHIICKMPKDDPSPGSEPNSCRTQDDCG